MKFFNALFISLILLSPLVTSCKAKSEKKELNLETVKNVDLQRYIGKWYEIARFDHSFEKNLVGVTATYSFRDDGKIKVLNEGYKFTLDGKHSKAEGKAKCPNPKEPGKLKVSFFWFFYADYEILELDTVNYQYALIGGGSPDYLWILSRTPQMQPEIYEMLLQKAKDRGYDLSKLIKVEQKK
jgi:apolipoprotein D and lipocalin family protein